MFNATSTYDSKINFEGLYQVNSSTNAIFYSDPFDNSSSWNVLITANNINQQSSNPGSAIVFQSLHNSNSNYDFATGVSKRGQEKKMKRTTVAINAGMDVLHEITDRFAFKAGAYFTYAPLRERKEKYKPIDKTSDQFKSIYNSSAKTNYLAYALNIGFVFNF